jgi:hypothetical protein
MKSSAPRMTARPVLSYGIDMVEARAEQVPAGTLNLAVPW